MARSPIISQAVIDRALNRKPRSKFNVRNDAVGNLRRTLDGRLYASAAERDYAAQLELKRKAGVIQAWLPQQRWTLCVNEKAIATHIVDFVVFDKGRQEVHEVKGHATEVWRMKRRLFEALYPDIPYIVVPARRAR